jgi:DNA-binding Lrp family transcriptional regulator
MSNLRLDPVDERILRLLVRNARATWREVGRRRRAVGQRRGAARAPARAGRGRARLDGGARPGAGRPSATALVSLEVTTDADVPTLEAAMAALPCVTEVLDLSGSVDYQVRVRFRDQRDLYDATNALRCCRASSDRDAHGLREVLRR